MQLNSLLTEDRAVSPVIGVILMVAITVILAAVIGTFVLGLGQNVQSTPQASFQFDFNETSNLVDVTHNGGDRLEVGDNTDSVLITGGGTTGTWVGDTTTVYNTSSLSAGDTYESYPFSNGDTVRVVWNGPNNESSATLGSQEAPA
jgi:flagellin-like protein